MNHLPFHYLYLFKRILPQNLLSVKPQKSLWKLASLLITLHLICLFFNITLYNRVLSTQFIIFVLS